jgi:hypothetical protein
MMLVEILETFIDIFFIQTFLRSDPSLGFLSEFLETLRIFCDLIILLSV